MVYYLNYNTGAPGLPGAPSYNKPSTYPSGPGK